MKFNIKIKKPPFTGFDFTHVKKYYNTEVLPTTAEVGGIVFDIDRESLYRLELLANSPSTIDFVDANNNVIEMQANKLPNYLSAIKIEISENMIKVNKLFNNLKKSDTSNLTNEQVVSAYNGLGLNKIY